MRCVVTGQYDLWAELRVLTLSISLCMLAPMRGSEDAIEDWYLNTRNVQWIMDLSESWILIHIWGVINVILIVIHWVLWIKLLRSRHGVPVEEVDQVLLVEVDDDEYISEKEEAVQLMEN